jgi:S-formylglutathione hydrolase FrmB
MNQTRINTCRAAIAIALAGAVVSAAPAGAEPPPPTCPVKERIYTGTNPRIQRGALEIGGRPYRYTVLLPDGYATSHRSYPTLYWLHGASGNQDSAYTDPITPHFMENLTAGQPVLVVIPEGGWVGMYSDWGAPGHEWETFHVRLVQHIDATYRTRTGRRQRAVAGFSMGGMGAIAYAARHPQLFGVAASFSGLLDTSRRSPSMKAFLTAAGPILVPACAGRTEAFGPWGDPATEQAEWERHNPTALVDRLRGTSIYVSTGNGRPCDAEDAQVLAREAPTNPLRAMEPAVFDANETFHHAMVSAGVPHTYDAYGCGIHNWRYWERELTAWWPRMRQSFRKAARRKPRR